MFRHINRIRFLTFTLLLVSALLLPIRVATAQLKATLEGHTDHVWSVAFSPNGNMLASASWDQTVRLWNVDTGQLLHILIEHEDVVNSVAFSPDGATLASGSWDGTIRLWNPHDGRLKRTLIEHEGGVASVGFSPDGRILASGSADQTIRLWDTRTWRLQKTITGHTHVVDVVVFSPDGSTLASGSRDTTIRLWNPNNGQHKGTLTGHTSDVIRMAFSPDGATLVTGSLDRTVRLWDPHTGKLKNTLPDSTTSRNPVAFSPDGDTLLTGGRNISLWDPQTGEIKGVLAANIGNAVSIVFSPDGQMVASGSEDNAVRLWEFNVSDHEIPSITTNGMVRWVYFVPDDRPAQPERVTALRQLIRDTQEYFADQMEHHGFGRKTFNIETDANGTPMVHRVNGKFNENYYNKHDQKNPEEQIWKEIVEHFDDFQHVYFIAIDVSAEVLGRGDGACGLGGAHYFTFHDAYGFVPFAPGGLALRHRDFTEGEEVLGGSAVIPASGHCFEDNRGFLHPLRATTHELAHAFGLGHDFSDPDSAVGGRGFRFSECEAEWLSVSRFFNTGPLPSNETGKIELLSVQAYNKDVINLRFMVTDPDGLHQAQLLVPEIYEGTGTGPDRLFDCKRLTGKTQIIESAVRTAELVDRVLLQIVDVNGNITWATPPIQWEAVPPTRNAFDVNKDGGVNIADLKGISSRLGHRGKNPTDINEDKVVNIKDLLLVAASLSPVSQPATDTFTIADVQKWLTDAQEIGIENEYQRRGVVFLQRLLTELGGEVAGNIATNRTPAPVVAVEASQRPPMYWVDADAGTLHRLVGDEVENLAPNVKNATSLTVDRAGGKLYWTEKTGDRTGRIRGANLDGIHVKLVKNLTSVPHGITLDTVNGKLYLTNAWGKVQRLNVDGSNFQPNFITGLNTPRDLVLDVTGGKVYWTETAAQSGRIQRANLDGSSVQNVAIGLTAPLSLAVAGGKVYWTSARKLQRANLDGTNSEVLETLPIAPTSIAVDPVPNSLYLTLPSGEIHRRNLDGSGDQPVVTNLGSPGSIVLGISATDPVPTDTPTPPAEPAGDTAADVNQDKKVNKTDLLLVVTALGESPPANPNFDVNADGTVNIADVLFVIEALDDPVAAAAPSFGETLTALDPGRLAMQIDILRAESDGSMKYEHAIAFFQSLLASIRPTETQLLANYPNPFNPETWIPYRLAAPADVSISIYSPDGKLVRKLELGHQLIGIYESRSRAAYWDGRNALGERVASGLYFYTLTAGEFTATRRMLILK